MTEELTEARASIQTRRDAHLKRVADFAGYVRFHENQMQEGLEFLQGQCDHPAAARKVEFNQVNLIVRCSDCLKEIAG